MTARYFTNSVVPKMSHQSKSCQTACYPENKPSMLPRSFASKKYSLCGCYCQTQKLTQHNRENSWTNGFFFGYWCFGIIGHLNNGQILITSTRRESATSALPKLVMVAWLCFPKRVSSSHYLTTCWPAPAALHTNSRIFTGTPWLRNSDDNVPDEGNLWPSGPVEYGDDGRLWW